MPRKQSVKSVRLDDDYFILDYPTCPNYLSTYKAFTYSSAKVFNSLPYHIRSAESVLLFKSKLKTYFFPSNAFLRRRRKKALLRVNDRGGGWIMCILALCRVCVRVCARPHVTRTSAVTSLWQYSANDHNS